MTEHEILAMASEEVARIQNMPDTDEREKMIYAFMAGMSRGATEVSTHVQAFAVLCKAKGIA